MQIPGEAIEGYLKPLRARDWDRGSLLQFRSFGLSGVPKYDEVSSPRSEANGLPMTLNLIIDLI